MNYSNQRQEDHEVDKVADREKDDMASRRISTHIPAPLRKKKNEENYKRFITPVGNPMASLQKHMRSKSLSDLNAEKKEEENQRAEINSRYEEMEKLKTMLKEDEDSWKSKLQSWKNRRRSVTEDARKRKEERDTLEREAEVKSGRRKTKTYKEIVEDKKRRDRELATFNGHDEYEFVSPRSSEADMPVTIITKDSQNAQKDAESSSSSEEEDEEFTPRRPQQNYRNPVSSYQQKPVTEKKPSTENGTKVEYKYTTKVTAQIGDNTNTRKTAPTSQALPPQRATVSVNPTTAYPTVQKYEENKRRFEAPKTTSNAPSSVKQTQPQHNSNVPKVLMRSKGQNTMKERPKSAHELQGSSTLPRGFQYNPTPKPFGATGSEFMRHRRTAFANRRNMWESMGSTPSSQDPAPEQPPFHRKQASEDLPSQTANTAVVAPKSLQPNRASTNEPNFNSQPPINSTERQATESRHPPKIPLVTRAPVMQKPMQAVKLQKPVVYPVANTAKLSAGGLSLTSPRVSKKISAPVEAPVSPAHQKTNNSLFDDMKICINQRPRSEKGFGFTVRGGDDGKPVIVDTVSAGGAADICQLCVSDEILAINHVPLAECKTQDDIVQLIVSSVITGHLSLNIRRYGKPKKTSTLGLSGTKVVMTPGGFVQVRSDKPGPSPSYTDGSPFRKPVNDIPVYTDDNNNEEVLNEANDDLPPPPSDQELVDSLASPGRVSDPRTVNNVRTNAPKSNYSRNPRNDHYGALSEVYSNNDDETDGLTEEVRSVQKALDFEHAHMKQSQYENSQLRRKLLEEQERLDKEEAMREQERLKLQEEARLEDLRVEEQLKRIQARSHRQMAERKNEQQRNQNSAPNPYGHNNQPQNNGPSRGIAGMHWLVEEAERRRKAESSGKLRMNVLSQSKRTDAGANSILPDHVIQHLTQRSSKAMGQLGSS